MVNLFIVALLLTFVIARFGAYYLHDHEGYKNKKEKSKTITGIIRRKTGFNFHHIHLGAIILLIIAPLIIIYGFTTSNLIVFAIGISLFIDQIVPYLFRKISYRKISYFSLKDFFISLFLHIIIILIYLLV